MGQRALVCEYGCEYSANPGDYFLHNVTDQPIVLCNHDGEDVPCSLVEKTFIQGTDEHGREYYGHVWTVITHNATLADLDKHL